METEEVHSLTLTVQIDKDGRQALLDVNQKVAIVRSLSGDSEYSVVCAAFNPFGTNNIVKFFSKWQVYASPQSICSFDTIDPDMGISDDAEKGYTYTFNGIQFDGGRDNLTNMFGITNLSDSSVPLTVGLAQQMAILDDDEKNNRVNAASVPLNNTIYFEPLDRIKVFTATNMENGLILPTSLLTPEELGTTLPQAQLIISPYLQVRLTGNGTVIHYDSSTNLFAEGPLK